MQGCFALLALGMVAWLWRPITANDTWMHLASGRLIVDSHLIPRLDPFSWTAAGQSWIDHEWLYQAIVYLSYTRIGINALIVIKVILILTVILMLERLLAIQQVPAINRILALLLFFWTTRAGWSERADWVSVCGIGFCLFMLERFRLNNTPVTWPLVILFTLWANMHGAFLLGLAIVFVYALSEWLQNPLQRKYWLRLSVLCALATLLNPYGWRLHQSIIHGFFSLTDATLVEWQRPPWAHMKLFWLTIGASVVIYVWRLARERRFDRAPFIAWMLLSYLAIHHVRNVPMALIACYGIVFVPFLRSLPLPGRSSFILGIGLIAFMLKGASRASGGVIPNKFPQAGCAFIQNHPTISGLRFYNDYDFGSYWLWTLAPQTPVFIDGRYHMIKGYPRLRDLALSAQQNPAHWEEFLEALGIEAALIKPQDRPRYPEETWAVAYEDPICMIVTRRPLPI